jgi:hypothetical protein
LNNLEGLCEYGGGQGKASAGGIRKLRSHSNFASFFDDAGTELPEHLKKMLNSSSVGEVGDGRRLSPHPETCMRVWARNSLLA